MFESDSNQPRIKGLKQTLLLLVEKLHLLPWRISRWVCLKISYTPNVSSRMLMSSRDRLLLTEAILSTCRGSGEDVGSLLVVCKRFLCGDVPFKVVYTMTVSWTIGDLQ